MSKVASAASNMGVDIDQLNGMMSTIISVTREAPESVGTALKTIFARMEDLELDGEDEYGVSLGDVSSSLDSMGVSILDAEGNMRDLGEVIEEVGNKWNSGVWSDAQKQALAIDLAGKR
jgi:TP901 family phage tail tape measure protein